MVQTARPVSFYPSTARLRSETERGNFKTSQCTYSLVRHAVPDSYTKQNLPHGNKRNHAQRANSHVVHVDPHIVRRGEEQRPVRRKAQAADRHRMAFQLLVKLLLLGINREQDWKTRGQRQLPPTTATGCLSSRVSVEHVRETTTLLASHATCYTFSPQQSTLQKSVHNFSGCAGSTHVSRRHSRHTFCLIQPRRRRVRTVYDSANDDGKPFRYRRFVCATVHVCLLFMQIMHTTLPSRRRC